MEKEVLIFKWDEFDFICKNENWRYMGMSQILYNKAGKSYKAIGVYRESDLNRITCRIINKTDRLLIGINENRFKICKRYSEINGLSA